MLPVLMHGDAAFAGQGVVAETLNLSQLRGYRTGGTVHVVVNNQVGFTTSPASSRSSFYSHRRGPDDPGADLPRERRRPRGRASGSRELAFEYRQAFNKDVVIDLVCYRRRGHNEGDDPSMTQPLMYRPDRGQALGPQALHRGADRPRRHHRRGGRGRRCATTRASSSGSSPRPARPRRRRDDGTGDGLEPPAEQAPTPAPAAADRGRPPRSSSGSATRTSRCPTGFTVHPQAACRCCSGGPRWPPRAASTGRMGEMLAFGSLLLRGHAGPPGRPGLAAAAPSSSGTRSSIDTETGEEWTPLLYLDRRPGPVLRLRLAAVSEFAAMGFEYGYSVERPDALVLWEAQFGDFVNGAQTIVDEFISSARAEVGPALLGRAAAAARLRGPGPGPLLRPDRALPAAVRRGQHDGRRTRRTPASYFHLLRRQAYAQPRRPLVVFTPKSMLRLKAAASAVEDFTTGHVPAGDRRPDGRLDPAPVRPGAALLRQGLLRPGRRRGPSAAITDTAIVRLEQLVPAAGRRDPGRARRVPGRRAASGCRRSRPTRAPWPFIALNLPEHLGGRAAALRLPPGVGRRPAAGSAKMHDAEQQALVEQALRPLSRPLRPRGREDGRMYFTDRGIEELAQRRGEEDGHARLAGRAAARVRRPQPGVRDPGRAAGHLAGPPRRRRATGRERR